MTTAHRPTWKAALGEASDYGNWSTGGKVSGQFSVKDLPQHTKLKLREGAQIPDFQSKRDLLVAETKAAEEKRKAGKKAILDADEEAGEKLLSTAQPLMLTNEEIDVERIARKYEDRDEEDEDDSDLDSDDDDDDDALEEELLQRELEKIKKEREEARLKKEAEESEASLRERSEHAMSSNPLLATGSQQMKRKWNDDVVFKNQARSETDSQRRFVNDTIRNDFHRRFLGKYLK
eukprot:CAMPEP_0172598320 /NCGR_PEP_ID=MMETSP1068-20121228/18351_1 /TAXON_ID=35684 /ORGANISM="Pseudopedinella elastica, Strain CCMP716" /LENGTH=233 /DNA_ID=CAMNT_0013398159 /DNA_START=65 /DNA_END=766 /DNA_ORIENTATION=-